jgi:cytochrome c biogenesis factor
VRAHVDVYRDGELISRLQPGKNRYAAEEQVSSEMAIYTGWLRAEDVDVIADQVNADRSVYFKVFVKPLVNFIWLAGFVFVAGALIALWPDARESRRYAERYERAVAVRA